MPSHAERIEFNPPPQQGALRSFGLALLAHGFLIAALTWGVSWKRTAENSAVEAELWSTTVMQAAPRAVETPPPPPTPPPTTARVQQAPPPPAVRQPDIVAERERKQREEDRKEREEQRELEKKRQAEKDVREKKAAAEKAALDKRKQDEAARKREDQQEQAAADKRRQDNLRRMQSMAGASGAADATGNAMQSSGPSAGYSGRLSALFKRNISFPNPDAISGNPKAIVEVRVSPAGLIIGSRLTKSSGVLAWDDAVLRAVEKTERIPSDNGRFVSVFPVEFGPKD